MLLYAGPGRHLVSAPHLKQRSAHSERREKQTDGRRKQPARPGDEKQRAPGGAPQAGSKKGQRDSRENDTDNKELHKIFDECTYRSGRGGNGEIVEEGKGKMVQNFKYRHNSGLKKQIWLPASEPADGQAGANVVIRVDPQVDTLLHLHKRKQWTATKGAQGNPAEGSGGPKRREGTQKRAKPLFVSVPPGTVVKDTRGRTLAELINIGDDFTACQGGTGGRGVVMPSKSKKTARRSKRSRTAEADGVEIIEVEDDNWKEDALGGAGEEKKFLLQLRVVADVGFVGLPNVGKSSLLRAITNAQAQVGDYPFTTLTPNLGVMTTGGDCEHGIGETKATLVDLPGLVEGAHAGRGLGKMFLRHLARTRIVVHVVDGNTGDPLHTAAMQYPPVAAADSEGAGLQLAYDYWTVREELRKYNPEYCQRPHIVAINKTDLYEVQELRDSVPEQIQDVAKHMNSDKPDIYEPPVFIVNCSAKTGEGVDHLVSCIAEVLKNEDGSEIDDEDDVLDIDTSLPADWEDSVPDSVSRDLHHLNGDRVDEGKVDKRNQMVEAPARSATPSEVDKAWNA